MVLEKKVHPQATVPPPHFGQPSSFHPSDCLVHKLESGPYSHHNLVYLCATGVITNSVQHQIPKIRQQYVCQWRSPARVFFLPLMDLVVSGNLKFGLRRLHLRRCMALCEWTCLLCSLRYILEIMCACSLLIFSTMIVGTSYR